MAPKFLENLWTPAVRWLWCWGSHGLLQFCGTLDKYWSSSNYITEGSFIDILVQYPNTYQCWQYSFNIIIFTSTWVRTGRFSNLGNHVEKKNLWFLMNCLWIMGDPIVAQLCCRLLVRIRCTKAFSLFLKRISIDCTHVLHTTKRLPWKCASKESNMFLPNCNKALNFTYKEESMWCWFYCRKLCRQWKTNLWCNCFPLISG